MRTAAYFGRHGVRIIDFQEPPLAGTGVEVAISYYGLYGTGLREYDRLGGLHPATSPVVLGRGANGIVAETGRDVSGIHVRDRVCIDPNWSCRYYTYCQAGMPHMCGNSRGIVRGFAGRICPPQESVYPLLDTLSLKHATFAEPLSYYLHSMDLLDVHLGDHALTVGMGVIGSMMVQLYRLAGAAQIVVVEPQSEKKELTEALGATIFLSLDGDAKDILQKQQLHISRVIECVGLETTIENVFQYIGKCAVVALLGLGDSRQPAAFNQYSAFQKEPAVKISFVNLHTVQCAINLLTCEAIDCDAITSKILGLEEIVEGLQTQKRFRKGKVPVYIQPHTEAIAD